MAGKRDLTEASVTALHNEKAVCFWFSMMGSGRKKLTLALLGSLAMSENQTDKNKQEKSIYSY